MKILEWFSLPEDQKEFWLEKIEEKDWGPAKSLVAHIRNDDFLERSLGVARLYMLVDGEELVSFATLADQDDVDSAALVARDYPDRAAEAGQDGIAGIYGPWIGYVYTDPRYRGNEYAIKLIERIVQRLQKAGRSDVFISSGHKGLYEKAGFIPVEKAITKSGRDTTIFHRDLEQWLINKVDRYMEGFPELPEETVKVLVSDYDGTLFFGKYKDEDVKAIKDFQKKGNMFVLNTGRALHQIEELYPEDHPFSFDAYICDSGATIADEDKNILYQRPYDYEMIKTLIERWPDVAITFNANNEYSTLKPDTLFTRFGSVKVYDSIDQLKDLPVTSLSYYFDTHEQAMEHKAKVEALGLPVDCYVNTTSVDVVPAGNSKAKGILLLERACNLEHEQVWMIGDAFNDIAALQIVDHGYLIDQAHPDVKEQLKDYPVKQVPSIAAAIEELETLS